jgi:hypothetical protein
MLLLEMGTVDRKAADDGKAQPCPKQVKLRGVDDVRANGLHPAITTYGTTIRDS